MLSGKQSKSKVLKALAYIDGSPTKFAAFISEFMKADPRDSQKLAWVIGSIVDAHPTLIAPHVKRLIKKIEMPCHAAVKRNVLRALSNQNVPLKSVGVLANHCFIFLDDVNETIAVRAFAMSILHRICLFEPELSLELIPILEYHIPHSSSGFQSRARKIITALS